LCVRQYYKLKEKKKKRKTIFEVKEKKKKKKRNNDLADLPSHDIGPYKIKKIVSSNTVELELPSTVKIHPVVNVNRIQEYIGQVKRQRKKQPTPVIIKGEKE